jgi:hypothetical protein
VSSTLARPPVTVESPTNVLIMPLGVTLRMR